MKKNVSKLTALLLSLVLLLSAFPVQAAETGPAPPFWWAEEDYLIFEGDPFYDSEGWKLLLAARQELLDKKNYYHYELLKEWGSDIERTPAYYYELALLEIGAYCTGKESDTGNASSRLEKAAFELEVQSIHMEGGHPYLRDLVLWQLRCYLLSRTLQDNSSYGQRVRRVYLLRFDEYMERYSITFADLKNHPLMASVTQAELDDAAAQLEEYKPYASPPTPESTHHNYLVGLSEKRERERQRLKVYLDNVELEFPDAQPFSQNNRTLVPISQLAKALGAKSSWDGAANTATITRANVTIRMTIGDKTAYVNGEPVVMDVAPCVSNQRTMIPVAYVASFFGQSIRWDGANHAAYITEDKSAAEGSNLEAWALPMGSTLQYAQKKGVTKLGVTTRSATEVNSASHSLSNGWGIDSREELINTILSMTYYGHNDSFLYDAALIDSMSAQEYKQLLAQAQGVDAYMWPYTKQLSEKWGDRGILCWDLFRMSNLAQWGYVAGYLTYEEALALLEPAAALLCENFSSWEEAYENYLDGFNWWARNNVLDQDVWQTPRGIYFQEMMVKYGDHLYDDTLFQTGVIPLSSLSWEDVVNTLD